METIKNYLEGMFASLPNTPEVLKAKRELFQMMEDKYNELIEEGKNDNEAVGVVISEFGNLDELADDLGIKGVAEEYNTEECRTIGCDEATGYVQARRSHSITLGLGIFFCIICVIGPILGDESHLPDSLSVCSLFFSVAIGVILIVFSNAKVNKWNYLFEVPSRLDYATSTYLKSERDKYTTTHALRLTAGIILCALCWIPCVITDDIFSGRIITAGNVGASLLFVLVGAGVFLIVQTNIESSAYEKLINLNGSPEQVRQHHGGKRDVPNYSNTTVDIIMHVFWPSMTCIYLVWSFLTFNWHISWIIWPIAGVVFGTLKTCFRNLEEH